MSQEPSRYRWLVAGDINGFFGLMFDNLTVLSYLSGILIGVFNFPADVVFSRMLPGTALGVLFGDLVYTWMAFNLARKSGRGDVTAMPLGLDTPSTIGLALIVLGPAFVRFKASGLSEHDAAMQTWYLGMATMFFMGIIKLVFSFVGSRIQRIVPQAGLLGSLAGIALGLIGVQPLIDIFGVPLVGLIALGLILYTLVAGIRLPFAMPGVFASVILGSILYYALAPAGLAGATFVHPTSVALEAHWPLPSADWIKGLGPALRYLPLSIPFALLTVIGGINTSESARVAGDDYNTRNILLTEAIATLVAGFCGGVAQSTPYIGHPAYKNMGSRAGYTLLTGIFVGLGGILGYLSFIVALIPRAALAPILVFVAFDIVAQSYHAVPKRHVAAVTFSFFPTIFRLLSIKLGNSSVVPQPIFDSLMTSSDRDTGALPQMQVVVALGNGFILTGMLWAAFVAKLVDRHLKASSLYLLILAAFSFFGIVHSALADGSMYFPWMLSHSMRQIPYQFTVAYVVLAILFFVLSYSKEAKEKPIVEH